MMKILKGASVIALAALLLTSCDKADYVCSCWVQYDWGEKPEELQMGYIPNTTANKRCMKYKQSRTEEFRGTKQVIECRVLVEQ